MINSTNISARQFILCDLLRCSSEFDRSLLKFASDLEMRVLIAHYLVKHGRGVELAHAFQAADINDFCEDLADFACFCAIRTRSRMPLMAVRHLSLPDDRLAAIYYIDATFTFAEGRPERALRLATLGKMLSRQSSTFTQIMRSLQGEHVRMVTQGKKIKLIPSDHTAVRLF